MQGSQTATACDLDGIKLKLPVQFAKLMHNQRQESCQRQESWPDVSMIGLAIACQD